MSFPHVTVTINFRNIVEATNFLDDVINTTRKEKINEMYEDLGQRFYGGEIPPTPVPLEGAALLASLAARSSPARDETPARRATAVPPAL